MVHDAPEADRSIAEIALRIIDLVDETRQVATYKPATLLALIEACMRHAREDGTPPDELPIRWLAEEFVYLYWQQVTPYSEKIGLLKQTEQTGSRILPPVIRLRAAAVRHDVTTPIGLAEVSPATWKREVDNISFIIAEQPLGRLQRPRGWRAGQDYPRFLFDDYSLGRGIRRAAALNVTVQLKRGAAEALVRFGALLRPLLEVAWARKVAELNHVSFGEGDLRTFLFNRERKDLTAVRPELRRLQANRCFYCDRTLPEGSVEVDHVIPWSRTPNDGLFNLVAAHSTCNLDKSASLPGRPVLARWTTRNTNELNAVAKALGWPIRRNESLAIARSLYLHLPVDQALWVSPNAYEPLTLGLRSVIMGLLREAYGSVTDGTDTSN